MKIARLGWRRDLPDHRDHLHTPTPRRTVPQRVDLRPSFPQCYDQGDLGSCTANAIAGLIEFVRRKEHVPQFLPSRLFIYYCERTIERTVAIDAGAEIRDGFKSVANFGAPPETLWPYDISEFTTRPSQIVYAAALLDRATHYERLHQSRASVLKALANQTPFVFGFTVYESFESDQTAATGIIKMPERSESVIGGHAVCAVGYDIPSLHVLIRNSWGTDWGLNGYAWMPLAYILSPQLAGDLWTLSAVTP